MKNGRKNKQMELKTLEGTVKAACHWDISEICLILDNRRTFRTRATQIQVPLTTHEARVLMASLSEALNIYEKYDEDAEAYFKEQEKIEKRA